MGEEELVFILGGTTGVGHACSGDGQEMEVDLGGVGGGEVNMTKMLCTEFLKN